MVVRVSKYKQRKITNHHGTVKIHLVFFSIVSFGAWVSEVTVQFFHNGPHNSVPMNHKVPA